MIFQWYIFALIFGVAVIARITGQIKTVNSFGQQEQRYQWLPVLMIVIPLVFMAGMRTTDSFGDTMAYREGYRSLPSTVKGLTGFFPEEAKDKGFTVISVIIKSIIGNSDKLYFLIIAAVCLACVATIYKQYSCNFIISIFLFVVSTDYLQWMYNGIRQFIAVSLIFACTGLLIKKEYFKMICVILIASTIHASALIVLPIIFLVQGEPFNKKTLAFLSVILLAILYLEQFTDILTIFMENTQYSGEVNQYLSTEGTSIQRVMVYSIPALIAVIFKKYVKYRDSKIINICVNMSILTSAIYILSAFTSGLFMGRLPIYFSLYNYILLPWEIEYIFTEKSARIIYLVMSIFYGLFYYYQVSIVWGL